MIKEALLELLYMFLFICLIQFVFHSFNVLQGKAWIRANEARAAGFVCEYGFCYKEQVGE